MWLLWAKKNVLFTEVEVFLHFPVCVLFSQYANQKISNPGPFLSADSQVLGLGQKIANFFHSILPLIIFLISCDMQPWFTFHFFSRVFLFLDNEFPKLLTKVMYLTGFSSVNKIVTSIASPTSPLRYDRLISSTNCWIFTCPSLVFDFFCILCLLPKHSIMRSSPPSSQKNIALPEKIGCYLLSYCTNHTLLALSIPPGAIHAKVLVAGSTMFCLLLLFFHLTTVSDGELTKFNLFWNVFGGENC